VDPDVYALAAWIVPALVLGEFLRAAARALDRFDLHNASTLLQPLAVLIAWIGSLVVAGGGLRAALWSFLVVQYGLALWLALTLVGVTGMERDLRLGEIARSMRYGFSAYGQNLLTYLQERLELFLVAYLLADSVQVGLYAVAASAAAPFRMVPNALALAVFPELAERTPASAAETAAMLTRHAVVWTVLLCALALPFVPWLVPLLFGGAYGEATAAVLWLLPGVCVLAASRLLARWFQAVDRQRVLIGSRGLAVVLNGGLCLLLVPSSGIVGAAQASLAANAAEALLIAVAFCAHTGLGARAAFALRRADLDPYRSRALRVAGRLRSGEPLR
jgi:O-antigen/teichoic acid export membrane protein